jgi:hypothetical protein
MDQSGPENGDSSDERGNRTGDSRQLQAAGLEIEDTIEREPYAPEVEHQRRRAYIFARKPGPQARP